ncbi:DUF6252 family protein [Fibrella aquatilis]|uniref:Uncharacterized protein n=1 Tax=Fibrella aquatilis TaxID=2817059 RepID=A0A939G8T0_9BACT|nr:DUF6252 family protein [Fibrella aquatilis]MBO0934309.1 hypothetical protein [Fibrella aquatilis]
MKKLTKVHRINFLAGICYALLIGLISGCTPIEPRSDLPAATQTGSYTMGCYIDGQRWTPVSNDFKSGSITARYLATQQTLLIGGGNDNKSQYLLVSLSKYTGQIGTYKLDSLCDDLPRVCANTGSYDTSPAFSFKNSYWTDYQHLGTVTITKHTSSFVSGTFEFEARHRVTGKIVRITSGRFDTPYITYL